MKKNRLLSSTVLVTPVFLLFMAPSAFAACAGGGVGGTAIPDEGSTVICSGATDLGGGRIGNGSTGATVNLNAGASVTSTIDVIRLDDAVVSMGAGSSINSDNGWGISVDDTLSLTAGDGVEFTGTAGIRSDSALTLDAGDDFTLTTENLGISAGDIDSLMFHTLVFGDRASIVSNTDRAINIENGFTLDAGDDFTVRGGTHGIFMENLYNDQDLNTVTITLGNNASITGEAGHGVHAKYIDLTAGDNLTVQSLSDGDALHSKYDLSVDVANNTTITAAGGHALYSGSNAEISIGDDAEIEGSDSAVYVVGDLDFEIGEDGSISAGNTVIVADTGDVTIGAHTSVTSTGGGGISFGTAGTVTLREDATVTANSSAITGVSNLLMEEGSVVESAHADGIVGTSGNDTFDIAGTVTADELAIDMDDGDDILILRQGANVGAIDAGTGDNEVRLHDSGTLGSIASLNSFSRIIMNGGDSDTWTLSGDRYFEGQDVTVNSGTLHIGGNLTLDSNSSILMQLGTGSTANITVGGSAALAGRLDLIQAGDINAASSYTLISTGTGHTGAFNVFATDFQFLKPVLSYAGDDVTLTFQADQLNTAPNTNTTSDQKVAGSLDAYFADNPGGLPELQALLNTMTPEQKSELFASQGNLIKMASVSAGAQAVGLNTQTAMGRATGTGTGGANSAGSFETGASSGDPYADPTTFWGQATGGKGHVDGDGKAHGTKYHSWGAVFGAEREYGDSIMGLFGGYSRSYSEFEEATIHDKGTTDVHQLGVYGGHTSGAWNISGSVSGAYLAFETKRPTGLGTAEADFNGGGAFADMEVFYAIPLQNEWAVAPVAEVKGSYIRHESYEESGAGDLNMSVNSSATKNLSTVFGGRVSKSFTGAEARMTSALDLGWAHEYLDRNGEADVSFANAPTVSYTTQSPERDRDSLRVGLNFTLTGVEAEQQGFSGYAGYQGDFAGNAQDHAGTVGIRYRW